MNKEVQMQVYIGIDWSSTKHDVVWMNDAGGVITSAVIKHNVSGFQKFEKHRQQLQIERADCLVGLETSHNLLIDYLWAQGYSQIYVVPPKVVKGSRSRYRSSGAYTDRDDARLLADILRTDRAALQPWRPDSLLTQQMRGRVSLHMHLTHSIVRTGNRLRSILLRYYPAALEVFDDLHSQVALRFIRAYPEPDAAKALSYQTFVDFVRQQHYPCPKKLPACHARLQSTYPQALPETVQVYRHEAVLLADQLLQLVLAKRDSLKALQVLFDQHPDAEIFRSLPGAGRFLAPALLIHFGDDRERFPTPGGVQALAGTCPVTSQSGKKRHVRFRRACNRDFRHVATQWARRSLSQSTWAVTYWHQVFERSRRRQHAYRCLANRWLAIAWKLWQTRQVYDEAYHLQQRAQHSKALH